MKSGTSLNIFVFIPWIYLNIAAVIGGVLKNILPSNDALSTLKIAVFSAFFGVFGFTQFINNEDFSTKLS